MQSKDPAQSAIRLNPNNPNHHLWCNNGTWWIHYTLHLSDYTAQRIRKSLGTRNIYTARKRRDELLEALPQDSLTDSQV